MNSDAQLPQNATSAPPSRRSIFTALACATVLTGVVAFISTVVYENSGNGAASLIGYAIGQVFGLSILLLLVRKKISSLHRLAIACLIASAFILYDKRMDIPFGLDLKEAQRIMASTHGSDPVSLAVQNPDNRALKAFGVVAQAALASQAKFGDLGKGIEPAALEETVELDAPRAKLIAYRDAARTASSNVRAVIGAVDRIQREETAAVRKQVAEYAPEGIINSMIAGIDRRHAKDKELLTKGFNAQSELYDAVESFYAHVIDNSGQYSIGKDGRITYQSNQAVERHNTLIAAQTNAAAKLQAAQKEAEAAQAAYQQRWTRLTTGDF